MKFDFTIRLWQNKERHPALTDISSIVVSDITLISKPEKYGNACLHSGNAKRFGYSIKLSKKFNFGSGSHSSPTLSFKGDYIDINVFNFPRFPAFYQDKYEAKNIINGYSCNSLNNGFPIQLLYRKIEFLNIHTTPELIK